MVGAPTNIACPNFILNTIVAEELCGFADVLEKAEDFDGALNELLRKTVKEHKRIIFSGNNYTAEWEEEAKKRGLSNLKSTVDALPKYMDDKNVSLFEKHGVLSKSEMRSRMEILLENYANTVHIEAITALDMARKEIVPSIIKYENFILKEIKEKAKHGKLKATLEEGIIKKISSLSEKFAEYLDKLELDLEDYDRSGSALDKAKFCKDKLLADMEDLRKYADQMELLTGKEFSPFPSYEDILYGI